MSAVELISELPNIINTNTNIESLEFVYNNSERSIGYLNFITEILSVLVNSNVDSNIKSLKFFSKSCGDENKAVLSANIFELLNKFNCLRSIDIRGTWSHRVMICLEDLLIGIIDNETIQTIVLDGVDIINDKIFTDTNFFDNNVTLCYIKYGTHDDMLDTVQHEGFTRNRKFEKEIRFKKIIYDSYIKHNKL